jgi:hypothetical protein
MRGHLTRLWFMVLKYLKFQVSMFLEVASVRMAKKPKKDLIVELLLGFYFSFVTLLFLLTDLWFP